MKERQCLLRLMEEIAREEKVKVEMKSIKEKRREELLYPLLGSQLVMAERLNLLKLKMTSKVK